MSSLSLSLSFTHTLSSAVAPHKGNAVYSNAEDRHGTAQPGRSEARLLPQLPQERNDGPSLLGIIVEFLQIESAIKSVAAFANSGNYKNKQDLCMYALRQSYA